MNSESPIIIKSFELAVKTVKLYKMLMEENLWDIGRQVLRSGTSIGANANEAQAAESLKDFIHKLSISLKEANELNYWIELIEASELLKAETTLEVKEINIELLKMLSSAINTSKKRLASK